MDTEEPRKNAEFTRGRPFEKGNPGRPRGSKNRTTAIAQALRKHTLSTVVHSS